ncbi:MAG: putative rane protein [Thermoanaerobaculia bacterium]|jgi:putative membrane protein|nr:putative rane protein [Thermoanaerobaculia bacterium]
MSKQLDPAITNSLTEAVRELEMRSCAEVVVEVRARSGSYAIADARFAAALAFAGLLVLLFSPWPFQTPWVAIDVAILYVIGIGIAQRSDFIRRLMTSQRERTSRVQTTARAVFVERGVTYTEKASGLLVYLSLLERQFEIVEDRGVLKAVEPEQWNRLVASARASRIANLLTLRELIKSLAPVLCACLPGGNDNRDELPDAPRFVIE